jgi:uncharacterized membrane protein
MSFRTVKDRVRHTLMFEIIGVALFIPLASYAFEFGAAHMGVISVVSATIATVWNFLFNMGFDKVMYRKLGHTQKTLWLRVLHVMLFEGGLMLMLIPPIAWYLGISLMEALRMDVFIVAFYMVYAFCFNWAYDWVFPIKASGLGSA